jgi:hypothetical protein
MEIIENEFLDLVDTWQSYIELFGSEKSIDIINKNCGGCFLIIQHSMNNNIILSLSRLLDPHYQGRNNFNENLTLETLLEKVNDATKKTELEKKLRNIRKIVNDSELCDIRNKMLAHSDRGIREKPDSVTGEINFVVKLGFYDVIEENLKLISEYLNEIRASLSLEPMEYLSFHRDSSCQILLDLLEKGQSEAIAEV